VLQNHIGWIPKDACNMGVIPYLHSLAACWASHRSTKAFRDAWARVCSLEPLWLPEPHSHGGETPAESNLSVGFMPTQGLPLPHICACQNTLTSRSRSCCAPLARGGPFPGLCDVLFYQVTCLDISQSWVDWLRNNNTFIIRHLSFAHISSSGAPVPLQASGSFARTAHPRPGASTRS
jgi:hypothetical protein